MSRFVRHCALFLALGMVSCATTARYEEYLEAWVGKPAHDLTGTWGVPQRTHQLPDGRRMYEYRFRDPHHEGRRPAKAHPACKTFFVVDSREIVQAWRWEGHDCVAE